MQHYRLSAYGLLALALAASAPVAAQDSGLFNTVKQKLSEGKQVVGGTVYTSDPTIYCSMAHGGLRLHLDRNAAQPADL